MLFYYATLSEVLEGRLYLYVVVPAVRWIVLEMRNNRRVKQRYSTIDNILL